MEKTFQAYSLIKFFSNEEYLNDLLEGKIYCNTPEYYRLANQEGMADKNESCVVAYRKDRNDEPIKVTVAGKDITSVISATIWNNTRKDSWLHCWFMLHFEPNIKDILCPFGKPAYLARTIAGKVRWGSRCWISFNKREM